MRSVHLCDYNDSIKYSNIHQTGNMDQNRRWERRELKVKMNTGISMNWWYFNYQRIKSIFPMRKKVFYYIFVMDKKEMPRKKIKSKAFHNELYKLYIFLPKPSINFWWMTWKNAMTSEIFWLIRKNSIIKILYDVHLLKDKHLICENEQKSISQKYSCYLRIVKKSFIDEE